MSIKISIYIFSEDESAVDNEYYCFLNVPRTASDGQLSAAYKKLARLYHPDKHQVSVGGGQLLTRSLPGYTIQINTRSGVGRAAF